MQGVESEGSPWGEGEEAVAVLVAVFDQNPSCTEAFVEAVQLFSTVVACSHKLNARHSLLRPLFVTPEPVASNRSILMRAAITIPSPGPFRQRGIAAQAQLLERLGWLLSQAVGGDSILAALTAHNKNIGPDLLLRVAAFTKDKPASAGELRAVAIFRSKAMGLVAAVLRGDQLDFRNVFSFVFGCDRLVESVPSSSKRYIFNRLAQEEADPCTLPRVMLVLMVAIKEMDLAPPSIDGSEPKWIAMADTVRSCCLILNTLASEVEGLVKYVEDVGSSQDVQLLLSRAASSRVHPSLKHLQQGLDKLFELY